VREVAVGSLRELLYCTRKPGAVVNEVVAAFGLRVQKTPVVRK